MKKIVYFYVIFFLFSLIFANDQNSATNKFTFNKFARENALKSSKINVLQKTNLEPTVHLPPSELQCFINGYPNVQFLAEYDQELDDWKISITSLEKTTILYWCNGIMLPKDEIQNKENYRINLWNYPEKLLDPAEMTQEQLQALKKFGSDENRLHGRITAPYFFDAIYDTETQVQTEKHIVSMLFLGKPTRVHILIKPILQQINYEVQQLAQTDSEVATFLASLSSTDCYHWRKIRDTNGKSFHSFGIAIDILPKSYGGKAIYWEWEKHNNPQGWMFIPLSRRWMPPQKVVDIFEKYGFVWGGKWAVWDNMHFEYHPELFEFRNIN